MRDAQEDSLITLWRFRSIHFELGTISTYVEMFVVGDIRHNIDINNNINATQLLMEFHEYLHLIKHKTNNDILYFLKKMTVKFVRRHRRLFNAKDEFNQPLQVDWAARNRSKPLFRHPNYQ